MNDDRCILLATAENLFILCRVVWQWQRLECAVYYICANIWNERVGEKEWGTHKATLVCVCVSDYAIALYNPIEWRFVICINMLRAAGIWITASNKTNSKLCSMQLQLHSCDSKDLWSSRSSNGFKFLILFLSLINRWLCRHSNIADSDSHNLYLLPELVWFKCAVCIDDLWFWLSLFGSQNVFTDRTTTHTYTQQHIDRVWHTRVTHTQTRTTHVVPLLTDNHDNE